MFLCICMCLVLVRLCLPGRYHKYSDIQLLDIGECISDKACQ